MTHVRTSRLLVSAALTTALAAAGVAATNPASADDTFATAAYDCDFGSNIGVYGTHFDVDVYDVPAKLPVGVPVEQDESDVETVLNLPEELVAKFYGTVDSVAGVANGLQLKFGGDTIPVDLVSEAEELPDEDSVDLWMDGSNGEFVPSRTGKQTLSLPKAFAVNLVDENGAAVAAATCSLSNPDADLVLGSVEVVKQKATVKAAAVKKLVKDGKRPKVVVDVFNQLDDAASGGVTATVAGKTVGQRSLKNGHAKLRLAKLPIGTYKVTLTYEGSQTVASATKTVTIKVVRR